MTLDSSCRLMPTGKALRSGSSLPSVTAVSLTYCRSEGVVPQMADLICMSCFGDLSLLNGNRNRHMELNDPHTLVEFELVASRCRDHLQGRGNSQERFHGFVRDTHQPLYTYYLCGYKCAGKYIPKPWGFEWTPVLKGLGVAKGNGTVVRKISRGSPCRLLATGQK
jgi:hypothetical protein